MLSVGAKVEIPDVSVASENCLFMLALIGLGFHGILIGLKMCQIYRLRGCFIYEHNFRIKISAISGYVNIVLRRDRITSEKEGMPM